MRTRRNTEQGPTWEKAKLPAGPWVTFQTLSKDRDCGYCPEQVQEPEREKGLQRGPAREKKVRWRGGSSNSFHSNDRSGTHGRLLLPGPGAGEICVQAPVQPSNCWVTWRGFLPLRNTKEEFPTGCKSKLKLPGGVHTAANARRWFRVLAFRARSLESGPRFKFCHCSWVTLSKLHTLSEHRFLYL